MKTLKKSLVITENDEFFAKVVCVDTTATYELAKLTSETKEKEFVASENA